MTVVTTCAGTKLVPQPDGYIEADLDGVRVLYCQRDHGYGIASRTMELAFRAQLPSADIVHLTGVWQRTSMSIYRAARRSGKPIVTSPRGALSPYSFSRGRLRKCLFYGLYERPLLRAAAAVHVTSSLEAAELTALAGELPIATIPNPVDLERWWYDQDARALLRRSLRLRATTKLFLVAGRLHHKKGISLLGSVLSLLPSSVDWHLVVIGKDEDGSGADLRRQLKVARLDHRTTILDSVLPEQLRSWYSASDALLLPSLHENFGNTLAESLACGTCVVASDMVGAAEYFRREDGVVVCDREVGSWLNALSSPLLLPSSKARRLEISRGARSRLSSEAVTELMQALYKRLL